MVYVLIAFLFTISAYAVNQTHRNAYVICRNGVGTCANGDGYANGNPIEITEWCVCRQISSTHANDVFIPTKTSAEWAAFVANPPTGVTVGACSPNPITVTANTYTGVTTAVQVPAGCTQLSIVLDGASGGGGSSATGNAGNGGRAGRVSTGTFTIPGTITEYRYLLGRGGTGARNASIPATGGAGAYTGGSGAVAAGAAGTVGQAGGTAGTCNGGAAGVPGGSAVAGAAGGCGGGGGGADNINGTGPRHGGAGGAASAVYSYNGSTQTEIIIAGGGGGGSGGNGGGPVGGNACNGTATGQAGGNNGGGSQGGGGGGGGCVCKAGDAACSAPTYAASTAGGTRNSVSPGAGDGAAGIVTFSYAP